MMQAADRRDIGPMLFERFQRLRELEVLAGLLDLPRKRVHAVGNVKKDAALRLRCGAGSGCGHALEPRQGNGNAKAAEHLAAVHSPAVES